MLSLFFYAFIISLLVNIAVIVLSNTFHIFVDDSNSNKPQNFHTDSTPRAGGIGILFGFTLLLFIPFGLKFIISIVLSFLSGIFEDFHNSLSPKLRLLLQFLAAVSTIVLTHSVITYLGLGITMPYWMGIIFSLFAIVGMMNAINIIDGFNGLASGVILLILGSFFMVASQQQCLEILPIIAIIAGSVLGFFILNFPYGKIFLGDGGAYMLGFVVALIGIFLASSYIHVSPWYVLAIFIYPVWEVIFSIIRKKSMGKSPMQPDKYHLHMLIFRHITKSNPQTSLLILVLLLPSTIFSTIYAESSIINITIVTLFIGFYLFLYNYLYKKEKR